MNIGNEHCIRENLNIMKDYIFEKRLKAVCRAGMGLHKTLLSKFCY